MAKSIDTILKELNLSEDSTLEELFSKLQDYSVVKEAEILGIKNISVTTLPTVVKNQEEAVKRKMVGIATDEEKGITAILNKRIAIISKLLRLLSDEDSNLLSKIGVSEDEINVLKVFSHSHANKVALDTITATDLRNYDLAFNVANSIKNKIINGKVYADFLGGYPVNYYASSSEVKGALSNANRYTDTKASELKQYVQKEVSKFTDISPESLQTLKELEEAFKEHEDEYDAILQQISSKATKVELNEKVEQIKEELTEKIEENTSASKIMFDDGVSLEEKYANGELGSGGGGGGSGVDDEIILITISPSTVACGKGEDVLINYNFTREVQKTRTGSEKIYVDGVLYSTRYISQGDNVATISNLSSGSHNVEIQVTSSGLSASLVYVAEVIELTISSTFDGFGIYTNPITYRYTPVGNIQKTIHLIIDGKEYTQVVNESNKAMTYTLKTLEHGSHKFSVYATAKVGGSDITSNVLTYDLVVNNGGTDTIIACPFDTTKITQGDLLQFNYVVFTPNSLQSNVSLKINGEEISNLNVDRTQQTWSLRNYPTGNIVCSIESGNKKVSFNIEVKAVDLKVEAISHNLELFLTSTGRSNNENESVRDVWENNGISVSFSNFNWKSNGWVQDDDGNSVLRINGDSRITIPFNIFAEDFRSIGKTIEFEFSTHDIRDYDSVLIDCLSNGRGFSLTSNIAKLHSEQTSIETKFKEDEKVRVSFVIEPNTENSLIYTYVNGIISGLAQYPSDDNFSQSTPVGITIGSNDATIDLYNIRVYNINLDHSDILTNFIADTPDRLTKFALYNNNDIFDSYGSMDYNKVVNRIPCLTFIGELPATKGDKKTVSIRYVNNFDSSKNFVSSDVTLDIQGTSSQYYPRKNYKFELPTSYKLTSNSIAETVFCLKADYMESSHSHNTGLAKIVNTLYPSTPASRIDDKVQAAITGFPIVVWYKETERSPLKCLGVYNFNNDKDDTTTFGYTSAFPNCESWEFRNNTSGHCLFQNDNFEDTVEVAKNFEARYPDKYTDYTNLSRVVSWVVSTNGDLEKFKNEFNSYFNLESTLLYYCLTELFAMVDSRAKNLFLTTWDGNIWYPTFYDMDTAFGLNNEGVNDFAYQVEYHDVQGSQNVFNGESSVLWNNFEQAYADEIQEFYNNLRNNKLVTYDTVMDILYEQQISKICENNYNYDAVEKYKNPLIEDGIGTYLYIAQGSRLDHLKWWLYNRINYMDSKYVASDYKDNYITLRIYTPDSYGSVIPNADAHITPYADQYVTVKYDENMFNERGTHDEETIIEAPNQIFNDTPMIIYGASRISDIGDLSSLYAGTVDVSKGIKLKQLIVGNSANDYRNTNLKTLTIGNNELLTKLDVRNCPSLTQTIDASGCSNIEEIYATGTSSTSVKVANGGNLKVLHLPNTITNLTIQNQPFITDFVCGDYSKISTLRVENTPLDTLSIVNGAINSLERVRLTNVNWALEDTTVIEKLMTLKGLNENGGNTDKAVLTGRIHIRGEVSSFLLDECVSIFGTGLTVTADSIKQMYKCEFFDYDGTLLQTVAVEEGGYATYTGENLTRPDEDIYYYEFNGWSPSIENPVQTNTKFVAQYIQHQYSTVLWLNWNGAELQRNLVKPNQEVTFTGIVTRPDDVQYKNYILSGWLDSDGEFYDVGSTITTTQDITLTAQFTGTLQSYSVYWYNGDELMASTVVQYGSTVEYTGDTPVSPDGYSFIGWSRTPNSNNAEDNFVITGETIFYAAYAMPDMIEISVTSLITPSYILASCTGADEEITIDWGDGDVTTYTVTTSGTECAKPNEYALGDYVIKLPPTENYKITGTNPRYDWLNSRIIYKNASFKYLRIEAQGFFFRQYTMTNVNLGMVSKKINVTKLAHGLFDTCRKLTNINIPNGVTFIESNVFQRCSQLTSLHIPASVNKIYGGGGTGTNPSGLISECDNLLNLTVDENNTCYDSRENCNAIIETATNTLLSGCKATTIPSSVKIIGGGAFEGCALKTITIPEKVTEIRASAFLHSDLNYLNMLPINPPTLGNNVFEYGGYKVPLKEIKVPTMEAYVAYTSATNWSQYADKITTDDYGLVELPDKQIGFYGEGSINFTPAYFGQNPNLSIASENSSVCEATITGDVITLTAVSFGTTNITLTMITDTDTFSQTFSVEILDDTSLQPIKNQMLSLDSIISKDIPIQYLGEPNLTVSCDNPNICTATIDGDVMTITATSAGTANITVNLGGKVSQTFSVTVYETLPYLVEAIDGITYGFTLNDNEYYESTNKGVKSSFSMCKLTFNSNGGLRLYLDCINSGENSYDFGILSNVDTTLNADANADSTNVFKSFKGLSKLDVQTVDYGVIEAGEHFIYIKYIKDGSGDNGNDSLQFKVRIE